MLCFQCGSPVEDEVASCPNCGADLNKKKTQRLSLKSKGLQRFTREVKPLKKGDRRLLAPESEFAERFVIGEMLGRSELGEVYRAQDKEIEAEVALKVYHAHLLSDPRIHERFLDRTQKARNLTQKNVVRVFESGVSEDMGWLSMETLEGLTLEEVLELRRSKDESFGAEELEPFVQQVTMALQHISRDFPHGNLRPENIIFLPELVKVTDCCSVAALGPELVAEHLGESDYLAPELKAGNEPDDRADVYSLGRILSQMYFGQAAPPDKLDSEADQALAKLCKKATHEDKTRRYPNIEALSEDFVTAVDTGALLSASPPPMPPGSTGEIKPPPAPGSKSKATSAPPPAPGSQSPAPPPRSSRPPEAPASAVPASESTSHTPPPAPAPPKASVEIDRDSLGDEDVETLKLDRDETDATREFAREDTDSSSDEDSAPPRKKIEQTATAAKPKPDKKKDDESSSPPYAFLAVCALIVIVAIVVVVNQQNKGGPEEVVKLGGNDTTSTTNTNTNTSNDKASAKNDTSTTSAKTATTVDTTRLVAAITSARDARASASKSSTTQAKTRAEELAAKSADGSDKNGSDDGGRASDGGSKKKGSRSDDKGSREPAKKATDCPKGMALVKNSKGNFCVDRYEYPNARGVRPKTKVTWFDARKSCEARGKRLCKLSEFRAACGSKYPYGSRFDPNKCNTQDEDEFERSLATAGKFRRCRSRRGAYDMSGNVHEWVAERKIAGGGFESDSTTASCRYSSSKKPSSKAGYIGFRCCADPG